MNCDNCKKEDPWLEIIGKNFICKRCVQQHKEMGLVYRTHIDTFHFLIRKLKPEDFEAYMDITREQIEEHADLKKAGIKFPTTNVVSLE
ncbi:hypothetical protein GOV09_01270 [Candidatus Woesearchaeota archaeon]|nr:hypothetical protein [Candidatus Woesearchaeota archaeon]